MARELAITVYLAIFKIVFYVFNKRSTSNKTTFVASFGGNVTLTLNKLERRIPDSEIIVLRAPGCRSNFSGKNRTVLDMQPKHPVQFIRSVFHLATSSHIFIDNYYGFLAACDFKPEVKCIQLWHAAGAIKQFGLKDKTNAQRGKRALQRFQAVYDRFDLVVTGSEDMVRIFKSSFGLEDDRFLRTGIPRTDFFFNERMIEKAKTRLLDYFPIIKDKKMLLYAPTYRDGVLDATALQMDMDKMYEQFKFEYVLFLRLHPAVEDKFANKYPGFIYNVSNYPSINDLLVGADILITDYSSIPFEFALLEKPMIFFAYDYDGYATKRGVWDNYAALVPGPVVSDTKQLIEVIQNENFLIEKVRPFAKAWNEYSNGQATDNVIHAVYETEEAAKIREHA